MESKEANTTSWMKVVDTNDRLFDYFLMWNKRQQDQGPPKERHGTQLTE